MTEIEAGYVSQGYELPKGLTWNDVAMLREIHKTEAIYVPVALLHGFVAWGVPMIGGKFMTHGA